MIVLASQFIIKRCARGPSQVVMTSKQFLSSAASGSSSDIVTRSNGDDGIATLTMNNPEKYNVLSWHMIDALQNQVDDIAKDSSIRVLVIGANGKAFSSGHDLREIQSHQSIKETTALFKKCSELMISLNKLPQPVIAKVNGVAAAAGCQLVASCDLAIASSKARFGVSGINLGLFCSTPAVALSRAIQPKQALRMLLTGELISAEKALSYGLLNDVVPQSSLESETTNLARQIATNSAFGIQLGKKMFYEQLKYDNLEDAYDFATKKIVYNVQHPDTAKGIDEFVNKKKKR